MRLLRLAIPVAVLSLVAACGSSTTPTTTTTTAAPGASSAPTSSSPDTGGAAAVEVLTGKYGTKNGGFEVLLNDSSGKLVTTLKAGKYQVKIADNSAAHNLHLKAISGGVDEKTTVPELLDTTWDVTLTAGDFEFLCDPHPALMTQKFTVT